MLEEEKRKEHEGICQIIEKNWSELKDESVKIDRMH